MKLGRRAIMAIAVVVAAGLIIAAGAVLLSGEEDDTVRIGVLPVIDTLPLLVADDQGLFDEYGIDVELVRFNSAQERDAAFMAGNIDGYFGDPLITILLARSNEDVSIITTDYHTEEGHMMFGLLSSPDSDIFTVEDIGDAQVAISEGSVIEYFLDEILAAEGYEGEIGKTAVASIPMRYQSLLQGNVELALLPEPLATMAMNEGAHLIADDGGINTTATVIVMRGSFVEDNQEQMTSFLTAYGDAVSMISESPGDYMSLLVEKANFPPDLVDTYVLQPLSMPDLPSESDIMRLQQWMIDKDMLDAEIPYADLVSEELY